MDSEVEDRQEIRTCTIILQLSEKDFQKNDKIYLADQEKNIEFKQLEHFSKELIEESIKKEEEIFQYFEQSKQFKLEEDEILIRFFDSDSTQIKFSMKFSLPPNKEVFFIDLQKQANYINQILQNSDIEINNACINHFGIQEFFIQSFTQFIFFLNEYSLKFKTSSLDHYIQMSTFFQNWENKIDQLRYLLKILFLHSINLDLLPPLSISQLIQELQKVVQNNKGKESFINTVKKVNNCDPWKEIVKTLENFCMKKSSLQTTLQFLRIRQIINSKPTPVDLIKRFINSATEPNLQDIFKQEYQLEQLISYEEINDLIYEQYCQVEKGEALKYLEGNLEMLEGLLKDNKGDDGTLNKIVTLLIKQCFKKRNMIQSINFIKEKSQLFHRLGYNHQKIEQIIEFHQMLNNLHLQELDEIEQQELISMIKQTKLTFENTANILNKTRAFLKLEQNQIQLILFLMEYLINQATEGIQQSEKISVAKELILYFGKLELVNLEEKQLIFQILYSLSWMQKLSQQTKLDFNQEYEYLFKQYLKVDKRRSWMIGMGNIILFSKKFPKEVENIVIGNVERQIVKRFSKLIKLKDYSEFLYDFQDLESQIKDIFLSLPIFVQEISKAFEQKYQLTDENGVQIIFNSSQEISLLLTLFGNHKIFKDEPLYQKIFDLMNQCNNPEQLMWKDYKFILRDKDNQFIEIMKLLSIQIQYNQNLKQFSDKIYNFRAFLSILQIFEATDFEEKQKVINQLERQESQNKTVSQIMRMIQFNKNENDDILSISDQLINLHLFQKIIQQDNIKQGNQQTSSSVESIIYTQILPRIVGICELITNQAILKNDENDEDEFDQIMKFIKSNDPKINVNYFYVINRYFLDFNLNDCLKQSKYLTALMENFFKINCPSISIMEFLNEGLYHAQAYHLIQKLIECTSNNTFLDLSISLDEDISIINGKQNNYSKEEFINDSAKIMKQVIELNNQIMTQNFKPGIQFIQNQIIIVLKDISSVYQLFLDFENEDLNWILQIDENDIAIRTKDFLNLKPLFSQLKQSIIQKNDIFSYLIYATQIFWPDGIPKDIDQIKDISKYCEQIKDRINEEKQQPSEGSMKRFGKLIQDSTIEITLIDSNKFVSKQNDDERALSYYQIIFKQHNKDKEDVSLEESLILEMLQRLNLVAKDQLERVFDKQEDKLDEFKKNRMLFNELFKVLTHLGKTLDNLIQQGSLNDVITNLTVHIKNNNCSEVCSMIQKFTFQQEEVLETWKSCLKCERKNFQILKLIQKYLYPRLYSYLLTLNGQSNIQLIQSINQEQIEVKRKTFSSLKGIFEFNCEQILGFYHIKIEQIKNYLILKEKNIHSSDKSRLQFIGRSLQQSFDGQVLIKPISNNLVKPLIAKKKKFPNNSEICSFLISFIKKQETSFQYFFCNQEASEQDIKCFLNRIMLFKFQDQQFFFIINFQKLQYKVRQYALKKIQKYSHSQKMSTDNELLIVYEESDLLNKINDEIDKDWDDEIQLPIYDDKISLQSIMIPNLFIYKSTISGTGKSYEIFKEIQKKNLEYFYFPTHQFEDINNLMEMIKYKTQKIKNYEKLAFHFDIKYDSQDQISIFLFQALILRCINFNSNQLFKFPSSSHFYVEVQNYFDITKSYATILNFLNKDERYQKILSFNIEKLFVSQNYESEDQIMLRYLNGMEDPSKNYFADKDMKEIKFLWEMEIYQEQRITQDRGQQLIMKMIFDKLTPTQKELFSFQHIQNFKKQFVFQISEFEQTYQYSSFYISELSERTNQNLNEIRKNIIQQIIQQSINNTVTNDVILFSNEFDKKWQKYYQNLFEKFQSSNFLSPMQFFNFEQKKKPKQKLQVNKVKIVFKNQSFFQKICCFCCCCFKSEKIQQDIEIKTEAFNQTLENEPLLKKKTDQQSIRMQQHQKTLKDNYLKWIEKNQKRTKIDLASLLTDEQLKILKKNTLTKYDNQSNELVVFNNNILVAAILKSKNESSEMKILNKSLREFTKVYNQASNNQLQTSKQDIDKLIPNFSTENQYELVRVLVNFSSKNSNKYIDEENNISKQPLNLLTSSFVFSSDNIFKLIQISYKIYSKVPVIIMGETGIGKTVGIELLSKLMDKEFKILKISAGTTVDQLVSAIVEVQDMLDRDQQKECVIFFDEINTNQNIHGLIKEIIVDSSLNGEKINDRIICIAACNPYEYAEFKEIDAFSSGILSLSQKSELDKPRLTYQVYPLPESLIPYVINFQQLSSKSEKTYIKEILRNQNKKESSKINLNQQKKTITINSNLFSEEELLLIEEVIYLSQNHIRFETCTSKSTSLRDVTRMSKLLFFFFQVYFSIERNLSIKEKKQRSIILSLYLSYQIRLNSFEKRDLYQKCIWMQLEKSKLFQGKNENINLINFVIEGELNWLMNDLGINNAIISKNRTLKENCFCISICILNKIPLFITGEPGTSKTLSFNLVINTLTGKKSISKLFQLFSTHREYYIQGNLQTSSQEIKNVFFQAKKAQETSITNLSLIQSVVFFDEIGQAELSPLNPNKVLHELLDEGDICFIAISNISLDLAKMNRCLHLSRNNNQLNDLNDFVSQLNKGSYSCNALPLLIKFNKVFIEFHQNAKNNLHNMRDYYFTVKFFFYTLYKETKALDEESIQDILLNSILKNFGGNFSNHKKIYEQCQEIFNKTKPFQIMYQSSKLINNCFESPCINFMYHARFPLFICEDVHMCLEFVVNKIKSQNKRCEIIYSLLLKVFIGSHFKGDQNADKSQELSQMNNCIEEGIQIISLQQSYIYAVYYDFFTLNLQRISDKQKFRMNYKQIQRRVEVPQDFIFYMIISNLELPNTDLALLNRFQKHIITYKDVFSEYQVEIFNAVYQEQLFQFIINIHNFKIFRFQQIKNLFPEDIYFFQFFSSNYIASYILQIVKEQEHIPDKEDQIIQYKKICLDKIGNLWSKYDLIRIKSQKNEYYQQLFENQNSKKYLDDFISFISYQQQQINSNCGHLSIIYTQSYLYPSYQNLFEKLNIKSSVIDLSLIQKRVDFQNEVQLAISQQIQLLIIKTHAQEQGFKNLLFIRNYLDQQFQQSEKKFSIAFLIQFENKLDQPLPFCKNWDQYQIDNLIPYIYNEFNNQNLSIEQLKELNNILNYRSLHIKYKNEIFGNIKIFNFLINQQGFSWKVVQQIKFEGDNLSDYNEYFNNRKEFLKKNFKEEDSIFKTIVYSNFKKSISNIIDIQAYDWFFNYQSIKGQNYEKSMINSLVKQVMNIVVNIFTQMEKFNLLQSLLLIFKLSPQKQSICLDYWNNSCENLITINEQEENKLDYLPFLEQQMPFSQIIFNKIEKLRKRHWDQPEEFELNLQKDLKEYQVFIKEFTVENYVHDFIYYKFGKLRDQNEINIWHNQLIEKLLSDKIILKIEDPHILIWNNYGEIQNIFNSFQKIDNFALTLLFNLINEESITSLSSLQSKIKKKIFESVQQEVNIDQKLELIDCLNETYKSEESQQYYKAKYSFQRLKKYILKESFEVKKIINKQKQQFFFKVLVEGWKQDNIQQQYERICSKTTLINQNSKPSYTLQVICTFKYLNIDINSMIPDLVEQSNTFLEKNTQNETVLFEIKEMYSHILSPFFDEIKSSFIAKIQDILFQTYKQFESFNLISDLHNQFFKFGIRTENNLTQLLIRIAEIFLSQFQDQLFDIDCMQILNIFNTHQEKIASFSFIFSSAFLRLIAEEMKKQILQNIFKSTFDLGNFKSRSNLSKFYQELTYPSNLNISLFLIKSIQYDDLDFLKRIFLFQQQPNSKISEFQFIYEISLKIFNPNLDIYFIPWKNEIDKELEQLSSNLEKEDFSQFKKENGYLLFSTIKIISEVNETHMKLAQYLPKCENYKIFLQNENKLEKLKSKSSIHVISISILNFLQSQANQQIKNIFNSNEKQLNQIYLPFNGLNKKEIQDLEQQIAIKSATDKQQAYICNCDFIYLKGKSSNIRVGAVCPQCKRVIGGDENKKENSISQINQLINQKGYNNYVQNFLFSAPRNLKLEVFRIGNLILQIIIYCSPVFKNKSKENIEESWELLKQLIQLSEGSILQLMYQCIQEYKKIPIQDLKIESNRNQFELLFSEKVSYLLDNWRQIEKHLDEMNCNTKNPIQLFLRQIQSQKPYENTLQICKLMNKSIIVQNIKQQIIPHQYHYIFFKIFNDLEDLTFVQLISPLIFFYQSLVIQFKKSLTKNYVKQNFLSSILNKFPNLEAYFQKYVVPSWNKVYDKIKSISFECKLVQQFQKIESSDKIPLEFFTIENQQGSNNPFGQQLKYMIDFLRVINNSLFGNQEKIQEKDLFDIKLNNLVKINQNQSLESLVNFEFFQLNPNQNRTQLILEMMMEYFLEGNLKDLFLIKEFSSDNYFEFKPDIEDCQYLIPDSLHSTFNLEISKEEEINFFKMCYDDEKLLEIRENLIYLHQYLIKLPIQEQQQIQNEGILQILKKNEFSIEEPYFKKSLEKYKLSQIISILFILEEKLMPNLVEEIDQKFKESIEDERGEKILQQFYDNYNPLIRYTALINLKNTVGKFIIRSKQSIKEYPHKDAFEQMKNFDPQKEKLFGELFVEGKIKFNSMKLESKFIYGFYSFLMKKINQQNKQDKKMKQQANTDKEKNQSNKIFELYDMKGIYQEIEKNEYKFIPQSLIEETDQKEDEI